jgi:multiple sugar transport system substrate-binding protein
MDTSDEMDEQSGISRRELLVRGGQVAAGVAVGGTALELLGSTALAAKTETITVMEHQVLRIQLMQKVVPHFETLMKAAGTPIKVNVQAGPTNDSDFIPKLTLDYSQGVGPDLTSYGIGYTPDFIAANYLKKIDRNVAGWGAWHSQFYPIMVKDSTLKGHVYYVPREAGVFSLFYRHDILKKHGISTAQPKSWKDLINRALLIKKKTGLEAGYHGNPGAGVLLFPAGTAWGGSTFEEGFIHLMLGTKSKLYNARTNKWVCKSKGLLDVFTFYHTLAKNKLTPVQGLLSPSPWTPTKYKAFPAGDLTICTSGTWAWEFDWGPHGAAPIPDIFHKVATWQFPTNHGGSPFVTAGPGWVWAIRRQDNSARQAAAFKFVEYMSSPRIVSQGVAQIGNVSPRKDAKKYKPYSGLPYIYNTEKDFTTGKWFHPQTDQSKMYQLVEQATLDMITLAKSPQQALNDFYNGAISLLGANRVEVGP